MRKTLLWTACDRIDCSLIGLILTFGVVPGGAFGTAYDEHKASRPRRRPHSGCTASDCTSTKPPERSHDDRTKPSSRPQPRWSEVARAADRAPGALSETFIRIETVAWHAVDTSEANDACINELGASYGAMLDAPIVRPPAQ